MSKQLEKKTIPLRLDRTKEVIIQVPEDAEFVCDLLMRWETKKVWDSVSNSYHTLRLAHAKIWAKKPDGTFELQNWPEQFLEDLKKRNAS